MMVQERTGFPRLGCGPRDAIWLHAVAGTCPCLLAPVTGLHSAHLPREWTPAVRSAAGSHSVPANRVQGSSDARDGCATMSRYPKGLGPVGVCVGGVYRLGGKL